MIFKDVILNYLTAKERSGVKYKTVKDESDRLNNHASILLNKKIEKITSLDVSKLLKKIESPIQAKKVLTSIRSVFAFYASTTGKVLDPVGTIQTKYTHSRHKTEHHRHVQSIDEVAEMAKRFNEQWRETKDKRFLMALVSLYSAMRTHTVKGLSRTQISDVWCAPSENIKTGEAHTIPLLPKLKSLIDEAFENFGDDPFIDVNHVGIAWAIDKIGYTSKQTPHGFRACFSTIMNEEGENPDLIEKALAHKDKNVVRASYNKSKKLSELSGLFGKWEEVLCYNTDKCLKILNRKNLHLKHSNLA